MAEDIRARAYAAGLPKPPSERAWGAVMTAARQAGLIEFARFGLVRNAKAHRTPAAIWRRI
jgi:hypothetical protein